MSTFSPTLLRQRRRDAGLTQEQLAVAIGRCLTSVRMYEIRAYAPPSTVLDAIADAVGCDRGDFFTGPES